MPIQKITLQVTVLMESDTPETARAEIEERGLEGVAYAIDEGDSVGLLEITGITTVAADKVGDELVALGSEPGFFPSED
jgi:hypothetical protein